jgi:hypothetical protein
MGFGSRERSDGDSFTFLFYFILFYFFFYFSEDAGRNTGLNYKMSASRATVLKVTMSISFIKNTFILHNALF